MDYVTPLKGYVHFKVGLMYNAVDNPNHITLTIRQDVEKQADVFRGNIKIGIQEVDAYVETIVRIDSKVTVVKIQIKSKNKRGKRKKVRLENDQEVEIDFSAVTGDVAYPFLWVRVDPEFVWLRRVEYTMSASFDDAPEEVPPSLWGYEAEYGRHVGAQIEATQRLAAASKDVARSLLVYGARLFDIIFCTRGCYWIPHMVARSEHACDR
jgi:hypothetical protein